MFLFHISARFYNHSTSTHDSIMIPLKRGLRAFLLTINDLTIQHKRCNQHKTHYTRVLENIKAKTNNTIRFAYRHRTRQNLIICKSRPRGLCKNVKLFSFGKHVPLLIMWTNNVSVMCAFSVIYCLVCNK